jgi:hypothetical protein
MDKNHLNDLRLYLGHQGVPNKEMGDADSNNLTEATERLCQISGLRMLEIMALFTKSGLHPIKPGHLVQVREAHPERSDVFLNRFKK